MEEKKNSFRFPTNRKTVKTGGFLFGGKPKEEEKPTESVVSVPASASVDPAPERDSKMRLPAAPSPKENVMEDIESLNPPIQKSQKIVGLDYTPSQAPPVSLRERLKQYQDLKGSKNDLPVGPDREKELERQMDASKLDSWAGPPAQLLNSAPPPAVEWSAPELPTKSPPKIPQPPSGSSSDGANEKSWVPASPREIAHTDEKSSPLNDDEESAHANDKSWLPASLRPPLNDDQEFDPLKNDVSEEPSESWVPQNNLEGEETEEEVIDDEFDEVTAASIVSAEDYEEEVFDGEEEVLEEYEENEQTGEWEEAPLEGEEGGDPEEEHEVLDDESEAQEFTEITDEQELVEDEEEEEIELVAEVEESSDPEVSTMDEGGLPDEEEYSEERSHPEVSPMDQGGLSDEEDNGYIPLRSTISNDGDDVPDDVLDDVLDESQGLFDMIDDDDYPVNEGSSKMSESEEVDETGGWVPVPADKEVNVEPPPQAAPTSGRSNRAAVAPVSRGAPNEDPEEKAPFQEKSDGSEEKIDYGKRSYRLLIWGIVVIGILAILAILLPFVINDDDKVIINNVSPTPGPSSLRGPTFATATPEPTFVGQTPAPNPAPMEETLAPAVTSAPTAVPTQSPSTQRLGQFIRRFLVPILGEEVFQDPLSPQYVTAAFMADEDAYISELNTVGQLADRFGAIIFYLATGGDNWSSCYRNDPDCVTPGQGPWLSGDVCEWFAITCDAEGRITSINFESDTGNGLTGIIPHELFLVSELQELAFPNNFVGGPLPEMLGSNATNLEILNVESNSLTGTIPDGFLSNSPLSIANLGDNLLTGPLPPNLGNTTTLAELNVGINGLSGPLPAELGDYLNLVVLTLDRNAFNGVVPASLDLLANLSVFRLDGNGLTGSISSSTCLLRDSGTLQELSTDCNEVACSCCTTCFGN